MDREYFIGGTTVLISMEVCWVDPSSRAGSGIPWKVSIMIACHVLPGYPPKFSSSVEFSRYLERTTTRISNYRYCQQSTGIEDVKTYLFRIDSQLSMKMEFLMVGSLISSIILMMTLDPLYHKNKRMNQWKVPIKNCVHLDREIELLLFQ